MTPEEIIGLAELRGFRSAPPLTPAQRHQLRQELRRRAATCEWCTIGVMAPSPDAAWRTLRQFERALGWPPLTVEEGQAVTGGPVFLKGHQRNGTVRLREEAGLAEGVLVSGHGASAPALNDTWGPLPLDLFAGDGDGAFGL